MSDPQDKPRHRPEPPPGVVPDDPGRVPAPAPASTPDDAGSAPPRSRAAQRAPLDIAPLLAGWEYEPGTINVRKVPGLDGREKLQMRLDLGLLQMELTGRPDGRTPHGCESLLEHHERQLAARPTGGTGEPFALGPTACRLLREEAVLYYRRYVSLFVLGDYAGVVRDTARNLRLLDFCAAHAAEDHDRLILEQYRPYILMMNTRAAALVDSAAGRHEQALTTVTAGLERIRQFFADFGQDDAYASSDEVRILKRLAREVRRKLPVDPMARLRKDLARAVAREDYERAARLRDQISARSDERPRA